VDRGLRAALQASRSQHNFVYVSDYEWYVELAGKGLAQRDKFPMPPSVTTPEAFYEIMGGAALDAIGLRALLNRMAQAERNLETIQDALRQADAKAENARHLLSTVPVSDESRPAIIPTGSPEAMSQ